MSDWRFTNPNAEPRIVVRDGIVYKEVPQISRLLPDGTKVVHPMFITSSSAEVEKVYMEQPVKMPERISLLEVPEGQWSCDVQLKPFQKRIIKSIKLVERVKRKVGVIIMENKITQLLMDIGWVSMKY